MTEKTGLPSMVDVVGETEEATKKYLDFVSGKTDMPILLDTLSVGACIEGLDYAKEIGILNRIVVNSLNPETKEEVYRKIEEVNCKSAVLLLYSSTAILSSKERVKLLENLAQKAEKSGIENILVDTVVMDMPSLGLAVKALYDIKNQYGYPTGCGAHNAIDNWKGLKKKFVEETEISGMGVANSLPIALGADFVLYGPIDVAKYIYPSIALVDTAYSQIQFEKGKRPDKQHPRYRIG